ncbi:sensor histidine kinase (plasmid) [Roseomonas sp. CCTCC AB2023176]|uniref:sensor histidine kinase n=1 Tax=Roseomonas sp. CCTCC AB2023176 TaxID=3342640 RepID=UPI0035D6A74E
MTEPPNERVPFPLLAEHRLEEPGQQVAALTAAVEARDTFIRVTGHELRNSLTPILGQIDLMLSQVKAGRLTPEQVAQRLERIQHAARRYMRRAGVLLDVVRINTGRLRMAPEPYDLVGLLREVAGEFEEPARRTDVTITLNVPDSLQVTWDRPAVEQIVDNLLANALRHGGRTPVEVSASVEGEHVCIRIRDHGPGIIAGDRDRVFGAFERTLGAGERRSGFGVGLWLVRQLSEAMGGTVEIGDAPGGGALFTITLPLHARGAYP